MNIINQVQNFNWSIIQKIYDEEQIPLSELVKRFKTSYKMIYLAKQMGLFVTRNVKEEAILRYKKHLNLKNEMSLSMKQGFNGGSRRWLHKREWLNKKQNNH